VALHQGQVRKGDGYCHIRGSRIRGGVVELLGRYSKLPQLSNLGQSDSLRSVPIAPSRVHAARRRLSAEIIQQLLTDYQAGVPSAQLAQRHGISKGAVLRLLREHQVPVRLQRITPAEVEQAIQLYEAGNSLAVVGNRLGYSPGTIHLALRRAGVDLRDCQGLER
jgi:hypothetical protein